MRANNFPKTLWHEHKAAHVSHEASLLSCRLQLNYLTKQLDKSNPPTAGSCQPVENSDKSKLCLFLNLEESGQSREKPSMGGTSMGEGNGDISRWGGLVSWWDRQDFCPNIFLENQIFNWLFSLYLYFQNFSLNEVEQEIHSLTSLFFTRNGDESEKMIVFEYRKI